MAVGGVSTVTCFLYMNLNGRGEVTYMEQIIEIIKNTTSAVILPHISADADAIASCQAMRCALMSMGIPSVICVEEDVERRLDFIADGVVVYGDELPEYDTCIVLDCGDMGRVGKRRELVESANKVINIDHHKTNDGFGDASLVVPDASATGEVLYVLFKAMDIEFNRDIARYLYTAICSDTGGFAFSNVSSETFIIAADLISYDINHAEISRLLFDCVDIDEELLKAELVKRIKSYYDGRVRMVSVTNEFAKKFDLTPKCIEGTVDIPRRIRGTQIAVSLKEIPEGIRVSLRSNGDADVSRIALQFGGGGHTKAAGCTVGTDDIRKAEELIAQACGGEIQ